MQETADSNSRKQGKIYVVGLGPGDTQLLAPLAQKALLDSGVIVGYDTYTALIPDDILKTREVISTPMTREIERSALAVSKACAGERVSVVCSGDPGIYGLAGLVLESLAAHENRLNQACGVEVEIIPGIPALAGAAALLGAPLTHDFAVISLSDLLTPWETIALRLDMASRADFVLVIYNPRSRKRKNHLKNALDIVGKHREPSTPIGLVTNAWRLGQRVEISTLADFSPDKADMLSIIFIGNSQTGILNNRIITPRGYEDKYGPL